MHPSPSIKDGLDVPSATTSNAKCPSLSNLANAEVIKPLFMKAALKVRSTIKILTPMLYPKTIKDFIPTAAKNATPLSSSKMDFQDHW